MCIDFVKSKNFVKPPVLIVFSSLVMSLLGPETVAMGRPDLAEARGGLTRAYLERVFAVITSEVGRPL